MSVTAPAQRTAALGKQPATRPTSQSSTTRRASAGDAVGAAVAAAATGAKELGDAPKPAPPAGDTPPSGTQPDTPNKPDKPDKPAQPSVHEQLEEARDHRPSKEALEHLPAEERERVTEEYAAEQSVLYDRVATRLEREGPPSREDFRIGPNGRYLEWEHRDALAAYYDQLEEAQQGAEPERLRRLRAELATTETGREMLEFERRAGVPIRIKTDREWKRDGEGEHVLAYSAGDEGLTFNIRHLNTDVYVHEMAHQVDHRTRILAPEGDPRSKDEVIAEARANYERYGLDPAEVEPIVDATYHQPDFDLTHAHTRLAEARHHRVGLGGEPLSTDEMREVLDLSMPRQRLNQIRDNWNDHEDEAELRRDAAAAGIDVDGLEPEQIIERITARHDELEQQIVAIEQRGTKGAKVGDLGSIGSAVAEASTTAGALAGAAGG